jgi:hypothetical protein
MNQQQKKCDQFGENEGKGIDFPRENFIFSCKSGIVCDSVMDDSLGRVAFRIFSLKNDIDFAGEIFVGGDVDSIVFSQINLGALGKIVDLISKVFNPSGIRKVIVQVNGLFALGIGKFDGLYVPENRIGIIGLKSARNQDDEIDNDQGSKDCGKDGKSPLPEGPDTFECLNDRAWDFGLVQI